MLKNVLQICLVCILNGKLTSGQHIKMPGSWSTQLLLPQTSVIALKPNEPGFDFSEDEMERLKLWPHGIIPYYIDNYSFDKVLSDRIRTHLDIFGGLTGVHFMELPSPPQDLKERCVLFVNRRGLLGCATHNVKNFTTEGIQRVVLGYDCVRNSGELSEVALAIVGVPPQHNAPNRDEYIEVNMNKIVPGKEYLFEKLDNTEWLFHDLQYDFSSASHFHFHEHSVDGTATITPKAPVDVRVGEGDGLSYEDVLKVRMLYNYITKKKHDNVKASECNKLFKRGPKAHTYVDVPGFEPSDPRPKPNKYLGLTGDQIEPDHNDGEENGGDQEQQDEHQNNENESAEDYHRKSGKENKSGDDKLHQMAAKNKARFMGSSSKSSNDVTEKTSSSHHPM